MPRSVRIQYEGARYHVMCRGNDGAYIFKEDDDASLFLDTLAEAVDQFGWLIHAYVILGTHYHLLLETPEPNLSQGMKWFQGTFTQRYHTQHRSRGHLYQGRFKDKIIDDGDASYFLSVADYIHLNPLEAGILKGDSPDLSAYTWSSCKYYMKPPRQRPPWLVVDRVLNAVRIPSDNLRGRQAYAAYQKERAAWLLMERAKKSFPKYWRSFWRGWMYGSEHFRDRMLDLLSDQQQSGKPVTLVDHEQRRGYNERAAREALKAGLAILGINAAELDHLKKRDERKMLLGGWLKSNFAVSNEWVAGELSMGHITTVSQAG